MNGQVLGRGWSMLASGWTNQGPAMTVIDDAVHVVVKDQNGLNLWYCSVDLNTSAQSSWLKISGTSPSVPTIIS